MMPTLLDAAGRYIASHPGRIAGIGAGLGAATGVAREALRGGEQKDYASAGLRGALLGGAAGGAVGGLGRVARDVHLMHPGLDAAGVAKGTAKSVGKDVSNFAQRQFHGLTGYGSGDAAYLDRIGVMGHGPAAEKAKLLNLRTEDQLRGAWDKALPGINDKSRHVDDRMLDYLGASKHQRGVEADMHAQVKHLQHEGALGQKFRDLGMTSLPGAVKSMATNPRESSAAIWNQLRAGGGLGVAAGVGLPVAASAHDLSRGDETATGGRSIQEKALRAGANIGGGLLFGGAPLVSQAVGGALLEGGAGRLGRALAPARQPVASTAI